MVKSTVISSVSASIQISMAQLPMRACSADGSLNDSDFGKPLPTIGLYVASASLCCGAAMAVDTFRGFRSCRHWFPSKYFTLNAANLTVLAVAAKLPLDLNTPMPRPIEQLSKLSSNVLICTMMGNLMPSLGVTDNSASDIVALGILVVTVIVNVSIQMGTGVIYIHLPEHTIIVFFMLVLLILLISSALPVSTTKQQLEKLYDIQHQELYKATVEDKGNDGTDDRDGETKPNEGDYKYETLKARVERYWLMAHTSSPQYVLGRSATCTASGAFCLLSALLLVEASIRSFVSERSRFCTGTSDYGWSIILVFLSQAVSVVVGTIAPAFRWFNAVSFRSPDAGRVWKNEFQVEKYWVEKLTKWKEAPLRLQFMKNRRCQKIAHDVKNLVLDLLIKVQMGVVLASKAVRLLSILPVNWIDRGTRHFRRLDSGRSSVTGSSNLQGFVLRLEGEQDLVKVIATNERKDTKRWIQKGKMKSPTHLESLVRERVGSTHGAPRFVSLGRFDSNVARLAPEGSEPPHCWPLPVVTLASIAVALPGVDQSALKSLLSGVGEGLRYVRLIEKNLEAKGLVNQRKAADIVWSDLTLYNCWFGHDLRRLVPHPQNRRTVIRRLRKIGETCVLQFLKDGTGGFDKSNSLEWPPNVLAANCMYKLTSTILQHCDSGPGREAHLFDCCLREPISDLLGACLTNLPKALYMECFCSAVELREESVRSAAFLLGEAEVIMSLLADKEAASSYPGRTVYVDDWREKIGSSSNWSFDDDIYNPSLASTSSDTMSASLRSISSIHNSGFATDESVRSVELERQQVLPENIV